MFTYSFDRVQKNTAGDMDRWNTLKYSLIKEYYHKSPIIPPFRNVFGVKVSVEKLTEMHATTRNIRKKIENNFYDLFISENGLSEKNDLRNWKSIFEGVYNLGRFFINLCRCRGNDVDSSLHANKWKRRIDRNKFKRPMKAYPGIDITEWNYFDAEGSSATMRRSKSNLVQLRRVFC